MKAYASNLGERGLELPRVNLAAQARDVQVVTGVVLTIVAAAAASTATAVAG